MERVCGSFDAFRAKITREGLPGLLPDQILLDDGGQFGAARATADGEDDTGIAVNQYRAGYGRDVVFHGQAGFPKFSVINLRPGHLVDLGKVDQRRSLFGLVQANAEDFESFVMKLVVNGNDVPQFRAARAAPGGPEVKQDDLSFVVVRELDGASADGFVFEQNGLAASANGGLFSRAGANGE